MLPLTPPRLAPLATLLGGLVIALTAGRARADDARGCIAASDEGQKLRDDHKFAAARERFTSCARDSCPGLIRKACQEWLGQIAAEQPSIVLGVRDAAGHDLIQVRVLVDGVVVATTLDGSPLRVDPGQHVLRFEANGYLSVEQTVLARQGEADREITVRLDPTPAAPAILVPSAVAVAQGPAKPNEDDGPTPGRHWGTLHTTGWVLGGSGLVALGVGAVFGVVAIVDNNNAHCNAEKECLAGPLSEARTAAIGSDIGLIAGGVLLATGVTMVLVPPRKSREGQSMGVHLSPTAGSGRAGFVLRASW
jgi:hypothetical protein